MNDPVVLGLDVGGTKLLGALVDGSGRVVHEAHRPTPRSADGADPGLAATSYLAGDLATLAHEHGRTVTAVGIGVPEYVDRTGRVTSHEVLACVEQPAAVLGSVLPGVRCVVDSDVRCGARAEWHLGAGRGHSGLFYVSLGTGLSCTAIIEQTIVHGHRGEAIALGELPVPAEVAPGWPGTLEAYASGLGIARRHADACGEELTTRQIAARAASGDALACSVLRSAGRALGGTLAHVVAVLDPPVVVLGGGLGTADTVLTAALRAAYDQPTRRRPGAAHVLTARLGNRGGVIGAALAAAG